MERIFLIGYMGSGKTTMGKMLAQKMNFVFVDMDAMIEEKYHKTVSQIFAEMGQDKFREIERQCLHEAAEFQNTIIATGGGAPCFFDNMEFMNSKGLTIYLKMTPQQLATRLESSKAGKRPLLADRKGEELRKFIEEGLSTREPFYNLAAKHISGTDEQMIERLLALA